ncbi:MAG: phosphoribosylanthranilate isomerase [Chloroflexi bacterium]|nr:phosphoribosylanthranilate isomerase [Chloroflexota bacterium]
MTKVKICGLRRLEDMLCAADAGADFVGVVFVPGVRRQVPVEEAAATVAGFRRRWGQRPPQVVGLFADQPVELVNEVACQVGLDCVQLCGGEPPAYWEQVQRPILKALHVRGDLPAREQIEALGEKLALLERMGHLGVLDRASDLQPGGLGQPFDWSVARALAAEGNRFLLAGGLTPDNVAEAVQLVGPYGVDVSSGVETDGVKDQAKIRAFLRAARAAPTRQ